MKLKYFYLMLSFFLTLLSKQALYAQFEQTTITEYENQYFQVRKTRTQNSDGSWTSTSYKYVFDYPSNGTYVTMTGLNMVSKVVEEKVSLDYYSNNTLNTTKELFTTTTTYNNFGGLYLPSKIEKKIGIGTVQTLVDFLEYDAFGNLKKYKAKDGLTNTFTYYTSSGKANLVASHTNNANQTANYDYKPLVGLSTVTDINLKSSAYDYDNFNRLKKISDHVGQLKEYSYHYAGQTVENPISSSYSVAVPTCQSCGSSSSNLTISPETWAPNSNANSTTITVSSNINWTATSQSAWLSVNDNTTFNGTNSGTFTLKASANTATSNRTGKVVITGSGITREINITQNGAPVTFSISSTTWSAISNGGNTGISVTSNSSWTASSNATSWLTVSPASGTGNGSFTITASQNAGTTTRTGIVTVTVGGSSQTVSVTQAGASTGGCPADEVVVGNQGGGEVVIKHFDNYYILCTKSVSGSVTRYVPRGKNYWDWSGFTKNSNVDQYYACINVNNSDWSGLANPLPSGYVPTGWLSGTFNDTDGNPVFYFYKNSTNTLSLSSPTWSAVAISGSTTVNVSSNVSWSASSNATSWLTVSPTSGSNNGTLTISALANTGTSARTGTITVTGGGIIQTVAVSQAGASGNVNVVSNGNCYTIKSKQTNNYMQLMGDGTIQQQVANNQNTQIWKAVSSGSSYQFVSQSNQQYLKVDNYNEGTLVTSGTSGNNLWNLVSNSGSYRISTPTNITWDLQGYGTGQYLQLYGSTSEDFANHRLWTFTQATCSTSVAPTLTVSSNSWSAVAGSTSTTVNVSSNVSWSVSSNATGWLTVSPTSGSNNGTLTLTATANTGTSARTGTITVTGGGITQTVAVTQAGAAGNVNVVSNGNCYTIKSKQTNNYMQLMGDGTIQQQVANNQNTQIWKAVSSGSSYQFVSQSNQQYLKVDNYNEGTLVTSGTSGNNLWNLVSNSGSYRISTPTNITWDLQGYGTGQYLQLYGSTSEDFANHRLWTFTQATCSTSVAPTLTVSSNSWSAVASSTSTTVNVSSNVSWTASSNATSWLTVSPTSGSNNGTLTLTATANTGTSARTGTITVTGGGITQTVAVTQAGAASTGSCAVNKVRLLFRADCCLDRLVGAKIRGSNNNSSWTDIYTFTANGTGSWQEFTFSNSTIYQYVRFEASANGYGELFELEFYNGTTKLTGTGFGGTSALDGDIYTFWHGGNVGNQNYAGIQINTSNCTTNNLSLSTSSWSASAGSTSTTVSVSSNVSWTASSNATSWLSVSPTSGSNNGTLTLTVTANTATSVRTGTITVIGGGITRTIAVTQSAGSTCGNTPQNYCLTGTIPANQFRYLSNNAYTNVAGPRSSLDGGTPPFYGNAGWIQGYSGVSGSIIYPTNQNDINLPVVSSGYRIDLWWPSANSKVLKLYVNGVQKWSQTTTCQDYCQFYPDFSSVVSGDRVYFEVTENATARVAVSNDVFEKQAEVKEDVLVVSPNPTDGKVKASFYVREAQAVRLSVIDSQGRTIGIYDKDADAGANSIDLDLQQHASGTYIVQLQLNNKQLVTKVIKQ